MSTGEGTAQQTATGTAAQNGRESIPSDAIREEYENLSDLIRKYRFAYYQDDAPLVSDAEFDTLFRRLEEIEALHPELVANDSPTQEVGGEASAAFAAVEHLQRMYSLEDVFSIEELEAWLNRAEASIAKLAVPSPSLADRTQDRRTRRQPALPRRETGPRCHPRRRHHG